MYTCTISTTSIPTCVLVVQLVLQVPGIQVVAQFLDVSSTQQGSLYLTDQSVHILHMHNYIHILILSLQRYDLYEVSLNQ